MLAKAAGSAASNLLLLAGVPFLFYSVYQSRRHAQSLAETARMAGLQFGDVRYVAYCVAVTLVVVLIIARSRPSVEVFAGQGSALQPFVGVGLGWTAVAMALLYGVVQTAFCEELLFRGLLTGSLAANLPALWANIIQAAVFLLPHLLALRIARELTGVLPLILVAALFAGWARIASGSILGPWIFHAGINVSMALNIAARSVKS